METNKRKIKILTDPTTPSSARCRRRRRRRGRKEHLPSPTEWRDWAALPHDVLCAILIRLPQADILRGAGLACASWRRVAVHEPLLWRYIDLAADEDGDKDAPAGWQAMARVAVECSAGRCESFRGRVDGDFLLYLADSAPSLRSLHVTSWFCMDDEELITGVIKKLPLLEQLVVSRGWFDPPLCALLEHCPRLRLLDAGGCITSSAIGKRLVERCKSRIKDLRLPQLEGCPCCVAHAQEYADEHDE